MFCETVMTMFQNHFHLIIWFMKNPLKSDLLLRFMLTLPWFYDGMFVVSVLKIPLFKK